MRAGAKAAIASAFVLVLTACQTAPNEPTEAMVWVRTDGQRGSGNPILERQYQIDTAACPGAAQMSPAASRCMAARGYVLVPVSQADATLRRFSTS